MPQVRILSLGPPYEKNRQKWRFFFVYCSIFGKAKTAACPRFSSEKQEVIHALPDGQIARFPNRSLIGEKEAKFLDKISDGLKIPPFFHIIQVGESRR